jgi:nucleoside-diphosphate-sugar epimerase
MTKNTQKNAIQNNKNIIVSGATGFIGRHVARSLIANGYKVTALVRDPVKAKTISSITDVPHVLFDIKNPKKILDIQNKKTLIHCAWGDVRDVLSQKHIEEHYLNNYLFIRSCVEQGINQILITGTCYEYGLQYGPVSAITETKPNTPYALAKDGLHKALRALQKDIYFELIWVRLFYVYGEGQDSKSIISLFDNALLKGDKTFNMSYGEQILDYLPVESVAEQIVNLLVERDGVFNICSGKPISLRRLLEQRMVEKGTSIQLNLGYYEYRQHDSMAIWGECKTPYPCSNL